ncbi:MAG: serine/threonine protein kinase, partial [Planctomycetes bacterium]|nr:serine/threonine protein kinase [Planctomycetota bacterium]
MAEIRSQLFGKLAISARLITQEQLDECLAEQRDAVARGETAPRLGELFERKGYLTRAQIAGILQSMESMKRRLFGEIAIELHFITPEQLQTGLEIQRYLKASVESVPLFGMALVVYRGLVKRMASTKSVAKIGEILIDMGFMRPHQVEIVLTEQAKVLVTCGACHATLNIGGMDAGQKVRCGQCGLILTVIAGPGGAPALEAPKDADVVAEEDQPQAPPKRKTEAMKAVATGQIEIKDEKHGTAILKKATVIGDFTIVARIGADATGTLYKARQTSKNRLVVLKLLHETVMQDKSFLQKYTDGAKKAAALDHPGIKKLLLLGQYNGRTFIAMEYAEGESILNIINREGKIPYDRALSIALKVAHALAYAAGKGVVHGDVRPSNLLVLKSGEVKISNLGLGGKTVENILAITKAGQNAPFYIAPEQVTGDREIDVRTDIYSLGATMYHMVAGRPPYEGQSPFEILMRLTEETIAPLQVYDPSVPAPFSRLVDRMLQVEPVDRYPTYEDLVSDMKKLSDMAKSQEIEAVKLPDAPRKTRSYVPGMGHTLSLAPAPSSAAPVSIFDEPKPTAREEAARPKPPWGLIGVGAGLLLIVVWFLFLRGPGEDPPDVAALKEIEKY